MSHLNFLKMDAKKAAAEKAVEKVKNGMLVGLGTGSTAFWAIRKIGDLVKDGLRVQAVASSLRSEELGRKAGIPMIDHASVSSIDLYIDGADEIDHKGNLIKGGGGALLREKILAYNSKEFLVIADDSKMVETLGKFPLPVEVLSFGVRMTMKNLAELGCRPAIRMVEGEQVTTDNGNLVVDCWFDEIPDPFSLQIAVLLVPGVIECGLFPASMVHGVYIGRVNGTVDQLTFF